MLSLCIHNPTLKSELTAVPLTVPVPDDVGCQFLKCWQTAASGHDLLAEMNLNEYNSLFIKLAQ